MFIHSSNKLIKLLDELSRFAFEEIGKHYEVLYQKKLEEIEKAMKNNY